MEEITRNRSFLRKRFDKLKEELLQLMRKNPVDKEELMANHLVFGEAYQSLSVWDERALQHLKNNGATEEDLLGEAEEVDRYNTKVKLLKIKVNKMTTADLPTEPATSVSGESSSGPKKNCRLPNVQIKKFNGKLTEWLSFWAQFKRIHEDPELYNSDKFWYLVDSLEKGTEVFELVSGYPQSEEHYPVVIEVLRKRYNNDILLQVYIRELLGLVISNLKSKEKLPFDKLFVKIDSHLRSLRSLNLEKADPATWLFPLVESSLPVDVLMSWQRSSYSKQDGSKLNPPQTRLDFLLKFMDEEVQIRQRVDMSHSFSKETSQVHTDKVTVKKDSTASRKNVSTVANFHVSEDKLCAFCNKPFHKSRKCNIALRMSYYDKIAILKQKRLCFRCLESHLARDCKAELNCRHCQGRHESIICNFKANLKRKHDNSEKNESESPPKKRNQDSLAPTQGSSSITHSHSNQVSSSQVYLQTLYCKILWNGTATEARTFIDLGSQRSYVRKAKVKSLGLDSIAKETVVHSLFGGISTKPVTHLKYKVHLGSMHSDFQCEMEVRDKEVICEPLPRICSKTIQNTRLKMVQLNDVGRGAPPIDLLIGADQFGKILTGETRDLGNGLYGINTKLGWTIIGEIKERSCMSEPDFCMITHDKQLPQLWDLEVLGIRDPVEVFKGKELEEKMHTEFIKGISRNEEGRYVVNLPWKDGHPALPTNKHVAFKRLQSTSQKLVKATLYEAYDKLFKEWEQEGFIEIVKTPEEGEKIHYLPHRAVVKESLTTPVRPVFDASCKEGRKPSLNNCLQNGCNFIALIPHLILSFREKAVAIVSDIRKAFQMIEVTEVDRDCLRFLWWKDNSMQEIIEYRHVRVPFGATCSPFILGAVLKHHLHSLPKADKEFGKILFETFYVDNCVYSVDTVSEYQLFKENAIRVMNEAKMDLRLWMSNADEIIDVETENISALGVKWNRKQDTLSVDASKLTCPDQITKRSTLATLEKVFDPIGIVCPVVVQLKLLLQQAWVRKLKWDDEFDDESKTIMLKWYKEINCISSIQLSRCLFDSAQAQGDCALSLHVFVDASQHTFATVVFLRIHSNEGAKLKFISAKTRISPPKKMSIPRMELLAAQTGAFLSSSIKNSLKFDKITTHFWSDSTTVLSWIRRDDKWGTFVGNRVNKILSHSRAEEWKYIPTKFNPADLPSRGCSPRSLVDSSWLEGPGWLKEQPESWPVHSENVNEDEVQKERGSDISCSNIDIKSQFKRNYSFKAYIRIYAWVDRFLRRRVRKESRETDDKLGLSDFDMERGEICLLRLIQSQFFSDEQVKRMKNLELIRDSNNLLRVKTRITERNDMYDFKFPVILPGNHSIVKRLIYDTHIQLAHAGIGIMLSSLREKYWILQARRSVKRVLSKCYRCGRYSAKSTQTVTAPLPLNRVKDSEPFEVTGIDLAGPLILKNGKKVWMVIYTCAVYRAVHLQVIQSLKTKAFIKSMMKFIQRFRRPAVVYSDNGTDFRGADNLFARLDWKEIQKETGLSRISWIFNPVTGSWWGGFWERLIKSAKELIRKTLGKAVVKLQELKAVIWTVERAMNRRPLTYVSESPDDLEPLTPEMFLNPFGVVDFPESELTDGEKLRFRYNHVKDLRNQLKERFRKEYLALLVGRVQKATRKLRVGELVFLAPDNRKRLDWPLARILELIPSQKDGIERVARIKTQDGIYVRPVQRLYPLEADGEAESMKILKTKITRSGREVKLPQRYT